MFLEYYKKIDKSFFDKGITLPNKYYWKFCSKGIYIQRFVEENVFGWLSSTNRDYLIVKTTKWFKKDEIVNHEDTPYVIYYLLDEKNKQLYIGSAIRLGDRVKSSRPEIPNWNIFKYDIIHPKYHHLIRRIEYHTIGAFASLMKNVASVYNMVYAQ